MEQRVSVLVNQRDSEVGLVRAGFRLNDRRKIVETPLFADALRVTMLPLVSVDDADRRAEIIRCVNECGH